MAEITDLDSPFSCFACKVSLLGQKYISHEEKLHCIPCYEKHCCYTCEKCKEIIKCDSKDLSFKDNHWHEDCFFCIECKVSLADKPFMSHETGLFCPDCYDEKFAARCDGCKQPFKSGVKKYEYKGESYHAECFVCIECKKPLGVKSFVPKDNGVVCVSCHQDKYAQKCSKCKQPINQAGVTYKGQPWHKTCFVCTKCEKELSGQKFTTKDEDPYCADCYTEVFAQRCAGCSNPIGGVGGGKYVSFEDKSYHSDCFKCSKCKTSLVGKGFVMMEGAICCPACG